jgi:hypothetical protein
MILQRHHSCAQVHTSDHRDCRLHVCNKGPVDCQVSTWSTWSACTATCGPRAFSFRTRTVRWEAENGGRVCPAVREFWYVSCLSLMILLQLKDTKKCGSWECGA